MDFYSDENKQTMFSILKELKKNGIEPPDYVMSKKASDDEVKELPYQSFADPANQKYPMHTKADTWLSAAYLAKDSTLSKSAKERIKGMIHKGAKLWDIDTDQLSKMDKILGPKLAKQGSSDETVIKNEKEFQEYCKDSINRFKEMEMSTRSDLSEKLLKTAEDYEWNLPDNIRRQLEKTAGKGTCHQKESLRYLQKLNSEIPAKAEKMKSIINTCMEDLEKGNKYPDSEKLFKAASLIDLVYQGRKLNKTSADLPENQMFTITSSDLDEVKKEAVKLPGGKVITKTVVNDNAPEISGNIEAMTGESIANPEEIIKRMQDMTPVLIDRLLGPIKDDLQKMPVPGECKKPNIDMLLSPDTEEKVEDIGEEKENKSSENKSEDNSSKSESDKDSEDENCPEGSGNCNEDKNKDNQKS